MSIYYGGPERGWTGALPSEPDVRGAMCAKQPCECARCVDLRRYMPLVGSDLAAFRMTPETLWATSG